MAELFVLIHAPVLGPASWRPVAGELSRRDRRVLIPSLAGFTLGGPPYVPRLLERASAQIQQARAAAALAPHSAAGVREPERLVLVVHSGAGVFAPYLAAGLAGAEVVVIFVDAGLPAQDAGLPAQDAGLPAQDAGLPAQDGGRPQDGGRQVIDGEFLPFLRDLSEDGLVPPWPRWWPAAELDPLFPDPATRERVCREADPLPLAFCEETLPPLPAGWRSARCAFLRFSEGYQEPARQAAARGWPVRDLPGGHLHMLIAPAAVAAAITSLGGTLQAAR